MLEKFKTIPISKDVYGLLFMVIFVGLGEKMAERFLPIYLLSLGASALIPGFLNGLDNFLSAVYSIPGGWLTSKFGYKKSLLFFNIFTLIGYLIVIFIPNWKAVIVGSFFFLSWTALSLPAVMDLLNSEMPENKRVFGVSLHSLVRRIPMALGPVMGGILIDAYGERTGVRLSFLIAFALGVISIFIQQIMIKDQVVKNESLHLKKMFSMMPKSLTYLLGSDILIRFCEQIPYAYIAIWAMKSISGAQISATQFGVLTAIEMVVALLIYIPVALFADKGSKKPFVLITFGFFTAFPMLMLIGKSFWMLILAFIIRGLKEFGEPTRKALIMELAPEGYKAATFGAYYFARDVVVSLSAFLGAYLWILKPEYNLIASFIFGLLGMLVLAFTKFEDKR